MKKYSRKKNEFAQQCFNFTRYLDLVCAIGGRQRICIPENYQKYDLPHPTKPTFVTIGVDIKELRQSPQLKFQYYRVTSERKKKLKCNS